MTDSKTARRDSPLRESLLHDLDEERHLNAWTRAMLSRLRERLAETMDAEASRRAAVLALTAVMEVGGGSSACYINSLRQVLRSIEEDHVRAQLAEGTSAEACAARARHLSHAKVMAVAEEVAKEVEQSG